VILDLVRGNSKEGRFTRAGEFEAALSQRGLLKPEREEDRQTAYERFFIRVREEYPEIRSARIGEGKAGYYSGRCMCEGYALLLAWREQDPVLLMAEIVRQNTGRHGRLTPKGYFRSPPYRLSPEEIETSLESMKGREDFDDILSVTTPAGRQLLYSARYLAPDDAVQMAEWLDVGSR
jgi:hypothetical protein